MRTLTLERFIRAAVPALGCAALPLTAAFADEASTTFEVRLEIQGACSIEASALDFGSSDGEINSNIDGKSTLTVNCTNGTPYSVALSEGTGEGASHTDRRMTNQADDSVVSYSLYTDESRSTTWNESSNTVSSTGTGDDQALPVYGRVPSDQSSVTVGTYLDTIVATVEF